jgi:putative SOS response-associated peptidase YedK
MIRRRDGEPFFIAGLWESWRGKGRDADAPALETFTLLTGDASAQLARIHARMPVVLDRGLYEQWLDPRMTDPQALCEVLDARPVDVFEVWPVSRYVNSPANDSARCLERIPDPERS